MRKSDLFLLFYDKFEDKICDPILSQIELMEN